MPKPEIRRIKARRWIALSTVAAAGLGAAQAASANPAATVINPAPGAASTSQILLASESGEGGENAEVRHEEDGEGGEGASSEGGEGGEHAEGGEAGEAGAAPAASEGGEAGEGAGPAVANDAELLAGLDQLEIILNRARDEQKAGETDAAAESLASAETFFHSRLEAALKAHGGDEFEEGIDELLAGIYETENSDALAETFTETLKGLDEARASIDADAATRLNAIAVLVRAAGKEYDESLADGSVAKEEPYATGRAFLAKARAIADGLASSDEGGVQDALKEINAQLDEAAKAFPGEQPPEGAAVDPSTIYGAAARIEIAALGVK